MKYKILFSLFVAAIVYYGMTQTGKDKEALSDQSTEYVEENREVILRLFNRSLLKDQVSLHSLKQGVMLKTGESSSFKYRVRNLKKDAVAFYLLPRITPVEASSGLEVSGLDIGKHVVIEGGKEILIELSASFNSSLPKNIDTIHFLLSVSPEMPKVTATSVSEIDENDREKL